MDLPNRIGSKGGSGVCMRVTAPYICGCPPAAAAGGATGLESVNSTEGRWR